VVLIIALVSCFYLYLEQVNRICDNDSAIPPFRADIITSTAAVPSTASAEYTHTMILFGDSITELAFEEGQWGTLLNTYLSLQRLTHQRIFDIQRRGFCGKYSVLFLFFFIRLFEFVII
jgi:hypothetical protein